MLLPELYRKYAIRNIALMSTAKFHPNINFTIPKCGLIHCIPDDNTVFGPDAQHPLLMNMDDFAYVEHVTDQVNVVGNARNVRVNHETSIKQYHKRHTRFRRLRKFSVGLRQKNIPILVNYGPAAAPFIYRASPMSTYHEAYNIVNNFFDHFRPYANDNDRIHWLPIRIPEYLASLIDYRKAEEEVPRQLIAQFNSVDEVLLLELYRWIKGKPSLFDKIGATDTKDKDGNAILDTALTNKLQLVFTESGKWTFLTFSDLVEWRANSDTMSLEKKFYGLLERLFELRTENSIAINEDDRADSDVIEGSTGLTEEVLTKPILDLADEMVKSGRMSGAEYKRMARLATKYTTLPSPVGEGTLEDHLKILPEDLSVKHTRIPKIKGVLDESMLKSSHMDFTTKYISKVMSKDIANMVIALQHTGIAITDYKVERSEDIANKYDTYTIKLQPVDGKPSTVTFSIPVIEEDGTYRSNNVKYKMAIQPAD